MTTSEKNRIIAALTDIRNNAYEQAAITESNTDVKAFDYFYVKAIGIGEAIRTIDLGQY